MKKSGDRLEMSVKVGEWLMRVVQEEATKVYVFRFYANVLNLPFLIVLCFSTPEGNFM